VPGSPSVRFERDALGELAIPADALWGIHTARALANLREHYGEERYRTSSLIARKGYTGAGFHG